jgi:hypothetical protein
VQPGPSSALSRTRVRVRADVVLAPIASDSAPPGEWTSEELRELPEDAAFVPTRLEQRTIDFAEDTSDNAGQNVSPCMEQLLAVAYPLADRELASMWRGLRDLAADREAIQFDMKEYTVTPKAFAS